MIVRLLQTMAAVIAVGSTLGVAQAQQLPAVTDLYGVWQGTVQNEDGSAYRISLRYTFFADGTGLVQRLLEDELESPDAISWEVVEPLTLSDGAPVLAIRTDTGDLAQLMLLTLEAPGVLRARGVRDPAEAATLAIDPTTWWRYELLEAFAGNATPAAEPSGMTPTNGAHMSGHPTRLTL